MKIGIDALFLRFEKVGGTESYLKNLLKGFSHINEFNEYYVFVSKNYYNRFNLASNKINFIKCNINNSNRVKRILYQNIILPIKIKKINPDIMFFPTYTRCINILDGISVISNVHDLQYKYYPEYFSFSKILLFKFFYSLSIKKSDHLINISDSVKEDIIKYFGSQYKEKMKTINNPIDFDKISKNNNIKPLKKLGIKKGKYILSVASLLPHKNITTLVNAFYYYNIKYKENLKLVLVGIKEKSTSRIAQLISKFDLEKKIIITGFVSDNTLSSLYTNALIFISTSKFEGFGMPPIEAMYNKIPVITTRCASLPEITLDEAYYYNPPDDFEVLGEKIHEVVTNYPSDNKLNEIANKVYENYNLEKISKKYIDFFENILR